MKQIPGFAHLRIGTEGEQRCHTLTLQEGPAAEGGIDRFEKD